MTATTTPAGTTTAFSAQIRTATMNAHRDAQSSPFMKALLSGTSGIDSYARLVAQHYFIYQELERAGMAMSSDPVASAFISDHLLRTSALEGDLEHLLGTGWRIEIAATDETEAYCRRIREIGSTWAGGFVAHHYVRYMGDLSGGQHIGDLVRRTYNLNGDGARFYTFDGIADVTAFKDDYRAHLDAAPWDDDEKSRIIAEILEAYALNTRMLQHLA